MATHFSILAWKIPWTEEPGGLQSMGSQEPDTTATKPPPQNYMSFHFGKFSLPLDSLTLCDMLSGNFLLL